MSGDRLTLSFQKDKKSFPTVCSSVETELKLKPGSGVLRADLKVN